MTAHSHPDRDTLLMMLSAYLDGELSAAEELRVLDALGQDPTLLEAFEALSAARVVGDALRADEAEALTASILAATGAEVPASAAGAAQLASLAVDGVLDDAGVARLDELLRATPAFAPAIEGMVASIEVVQVAARAVGALPAVQPALRASADRVEVAIAAAERLGTLGSAALDGALTAAEEAELAAGLPQAADDLARLRAARFAGEALAASADSAVFVAAARKAGEAALHAIDAEANRAKDGAARKTREDAPIGLLSRLRVALGGWSAPLAFAATAATLFFVLREPGSASDDLAAREATKKALFDALAPTLIADSVDLAALPSDLPLLADNSADVEAIDATATTMVFATEQSNITVIWIGDLDESQGT